MITLSELPDSSICTRVTMPIWTSRNFHSTFCTRGNAYLDSQIPPLHFLHSWQCLSGLPDTSSALPVVMAMSIWTPRHLLCTSCSRGNVYLDSQTPPLHFLQSWQCVSGLPDTSSALPAVMAMCIWTPRHLLCTSCSRWQCLSGLPDTSSALPAVVAMCIWTPRYLLCGPPNSPQ